MTDQKKLIDGLVEDLLRVIHEYDDSLYMATVIGCVSVLMQVDLPALERPTKAISGTSRAGRWNNSAAVVKNRAVCIHPMGVTTGGAASA